MESSSGNTVECSEVETCSVTETSDSSRIGDENESVVSSIVTDNVSPIVCNNEVKVLNICDKTDQDSAVEMSGEVTCRKSEDCSSEQLEMDGVTSKDDEDGSSNRIEITSENIHINIKESQTTSSSSVENKGLENKDISSPVQNAEVKSLGISTSVPDTSDSNLAVLNGTQITSSEGDSKQVQVKILDGSLTTEQPVKSAINVGEASCAFTKCQSGDSGSSDSEEDSSSSVSSTSDSDVKVPEVSDASEESEHDEPQPRAAEKKKETEEEEEEKGKKKGNRYKDEFDMDELPPIEDLHITVLEEECEPLGTIYSIVNQLVVIESLPNKPALNLDSILFKKDGCCLGQIFDVFGPVKTPFYSLRFNSRQEITDKDINLGQTVYCAPQTPHTKYVFVYQLMQQKGSDASWKHNYEVPDSKKDFSDDEEEKKASRRRDQRTRGRPQIKNEEFSTPQKKSIKTEFNSDYSRYTGNEWYKARVNDLNQFGRKNMNSHQGFTARAGGSVTSGQQSFSSPPPLIRPCVPNEWARQPPPPSPAPPAYNFSNNYPQNDVHPPGVFNTGLPQFCDSPAPFRSPHFPTFSSPPTSESVNHQPVHFANNTMSFSRPPPMYLPRAGMLQTPRPVMRHPFRSVNTRRTELASPPPLETIQPLQRPAIPPNMRQPWSSSVPTNSPTHFSPTNRPPPQY